MRLTRQGKRHRFSGEGEAQNGNSGLGVLLVVTAYVRTHRLVLDPDTWWHTKVGQRIFATWTWPTTDPYSFTAYGHPWIAYEWAGEVLMGLAAQMAGLQGLTALLVGLTSLLTLLLYYYAYLRSGNSKAAFVACMLVLPMAGVVFTLRPQLLGYIFLLVTLISLERFRQGRDRALWILPAVYLLWVNTHGSFAFGFLALGWFWVSGLVDFHKGELLAQRWTTRQRRQLGLVFLLCLLVLPFTPYGTQLAAYPLEVALQQPIAIANIEEWRPLGVDSWLGKTVLGFFLGFLLVQMTLRPKYQLADIGLLLFSFYSTLMHTRFVLLFALLLAPFVAVLLARWMPRYHPTKDKYVLNAVLMGVIAATMLAYFPSRQKLEERVADEYPSRAVTYLHQHPVGGNLLNDYFFGGYLIWSRSPQHRVFIDGRADIYEYTGVLSDYVHLIALAQDTPQLLRKYQIDACLLQPGNSLAARV